MVVKEAMIAQMNPMVTQKVKNILLKMYSSPSSGNGKRKMSMPVSAQAQP